jgi:(1->4)-alpha-D-glucan 1-alpha-D-glucosylmutase
MGAAGLVDPDNRRPVDYEIRAAALTELRGKLDNLGDRKTLLAGLLESWQDAKIKLAVTALLLDLRRMQEDLFDTGGYEALPIKGKKSERALGYFRNGGDERVAVLVARFPGLPDLDPDWSGTTASRPEGRWTDWLTGRRYEGGAIDLASLFEILPAVVLRQSETF